MDEALDEALDGAMDATIFAVDEASVKGHRSTEESPKSKIPVCSSNNCRYRQCKYEEDLGWLPWEYHRDVALHPKGSATTGSSQRRFIWKTHVERWTFYQELLLQLRIFRLPMTSIQSSRAIGRLKLADFTLATSNVVIGEHPTHHRRIKDSVGRTVVAVIF